MAIKHIIVLFVETPRKFITAKLSIRTTGSSSVLLISKKKKDYNKKLTESLVENPKRFWSAVKLSTKTRQNANFLRTDNDLTTDKLYMANILNKFFHSVFNAQDTETPAMPYKLSIPTCSQLSNIVFTEFEVAEVLRYLDPPKACGPDGIPSRLLLELADEIAPSLSILLNMSLSLGVVLSKWKLANLTPVFKADDPTLSSNYRPISVLCVLFKVLERCIHKHSYQHLARLIYDRSTIVDTVSSGVNQQQHNCWRYTKTSWNLLLLVKKLMSYTSICQKLLTKYHIICSCRNLRILGSVGLSYLGIKAISVIGDNELFFMVLV
jgi:hypothetical protein